MLNIVLSIAAMLLVDHHAADQLRRLEPHVGKHAAEHIARAQAAAAETGVDQSLLIAIAWHETKLDFNHRQLESDGRVSCGVGSITPVSSEAECQEHITTGYVAVGRHVHGWLVARDRRTLVTLSRHDALIGVAGGYALIELCRKGPVFVRKGVDACKTPEVFDAIADGIRAPASISRR